MKQNKTISRKDYNDILLDAIPMLHSLPRCSGGEGTAYFYGDEYVIKEYTNYHNWGYFDAVFELHCREMQKYHEKGYAVPEIYAYLKMPNMRYYTGHAENQNKYYILEEKLPGRHLFHGFLEDTYHTVRDLFSFSEFKKVISKPDDNLAEFKEIVKIFINDYIQMNQLLESLPEAEFGRFVAELYDMYLGATYSVPDIHPSNILVYDRHLSLIDNQVVVADEKREKQEYLQGSFVNDLLNMFFYNNEVFELSRGALNSLKNKRSVNFSYLRRENCKVCKAAVLKTVQAMNKYCDNPVVSDYRSRTLIFSTLNNYLTLDDSVEVMKNIHFAELGE